MFEFNCPSEGLGLKPLPSKPVKSVTTGEFRLSIERLAKALVATVKRERKLILSKNRGNFIDWGSLGFGVWGLG
ncbi:MAG: hypothetical protein ACJAT5_000398 [Lentimonas sp.]|jgi:hypothetical protein